MGEQAEKFFVGSGGWIRLDARCPQSSTALRLFKRLIETGKSTRKGISFKMIGQVNNFSVLGLPEFLNGYNGKPVLVTESYRGTGMRSRADRTNTFIMFLSGD